MCFFAFDTGKLTEIAEVTATHFAVHLQLGI